MSTFEKAFEDVKKLTEKFQNNLDFYTRSDYQEAEARMHFINPFFEALGWDVQGSQHPNPYEQEVKVEKTQKQHQSKAQKRADYAFYISPNYKDVHFFVEAKKPAVELRHPDNYFQTIRYAWNANTPIAALTDFEQFHILDCRYKPDIKSIFNGQNKEYRFTDYLDKEKFAEIYWLFSKEAVVNNSISKYASELPKPKTKVVQKTLFRGAYQAIDDSFLEYIDITREDLAKAFKKNDQELNSEQLTEAVQRTVDRLVFIRFLEDKLIEPSSHVSEWHGWKDFIADCRKLDSKYNGVVFKKHFIDDQDFAGAEEKMFKDICSDISNLNSPYDFNYIPIHILGSIYERFLGKIIVLKGKTPKLEEKPEVRKAGGVYYTPKYIVDYIVENTIGKLIEGKTPKVISELHFADIACGSGSFLIGAYDYLLDYHKKYYIKKPAGAEKDGCIFKDGVWTLSLKQKRDILINNIFGVDIDQQAVEVTQVSLFLKMLEEETTASVQLGDNKLFKHVSILPDLSKNIICGNSVIGTDVLQKGLFNTQSLDFGEERKLNPMDFDVKFPSIVLKNGFDAIIGNPPYVRQESLGNQKDYFKEKYKVYHGMADLYTYFFERGLDLLKNDGIFGVIVGSKWMRAKYGEPLRKWLKNQHLKQIIDFGDLAVFKGATTYTCIPILSPQNKEVNENDYSFDAINVETLDFDSLTNYVRRHKIKLNVSALDENGWTLATQNEKNLFNLIINKGISLKKYVSDKIFYGIKTGFNKAFVIDSKTRSKLIEEDTRSGEIIKPYLAGKDIKRYQEPKSDKFLIFTRRGVNINNYPAIKNHLSQFKTQLLPKPKDWKGEKWKGRKPGIYKWYEIQDTVDYWQVFESSKILWPGISLDVAAFALDINRYYGNDNNQLIETDDRYLLGILNSKLSKFILTQICDKVQGGFYRLKIIYIEQIPIKIAKTKAEKGLHDNLVLLVNQLLEGKKQLSEAKTDRDRNFLDNKCNSLDRQIDKIVYQLYELTESEINIIENK